AIAASIMIRSKRMGMPPGLSDAINGPGRPVEVLKFMCNIDILQRESSIAAAYLIAIEGSKPQKWEKLPETS
ncbi:MAG: hypothetical protein JXA24_07265, partial [Proteobacteria bacterium]|nr:hypothetical protein [Pseudomonadota bacterium]